jgi:transposase
MHNNEKRIEFHRLALTGLRYGEIAQKLEIGLSAVYRWRNELKIKTRQRGRKKAQK